MVSTLAFAARWTIRLALVLILADAVYLYSLWRERPIAPAGPVPPSSFIEAYAADRVGGADLPPLRWDPVPLSAIPERVWRAFVIAEDARFFVHNGVDVDAILTAVEDTVERDRPLRGEWSCLSPEAAGARPW